MEKLSLSSRELLYIAAQSGAEEFMGIPDGFYGMDESEIADEIIHIKNSLTEKNYAEMDFDGEFNIKKDILDTISACASFEKYIAFDKTNKNAAKSLRYYIKDGAVYAIDSDNGRYTVRSIRADEIFEHILKHMRWESDRLLDIQKVFLENVLLEKVKRMNELENPENELKLMGCDSITAKLIYNGLLGEADYHSFVLIDYNNTEEQIKSLIFIHSVDGTVKLTPTSNENAEGITVSAADSKQLSGEIQKILSQITSETEAAFE